MQYSNYAPNKRSAGMETAAFVLGIISIVTCTCIYASVVCGALAVMFALLSKGGATSMSSRARYAMILGIAGIVVTVILYAYAFTYAIHTYGSIENLLKAYCDMAGLDFNELYGSFFSN